jgi:hypothetical protein
MIFRNSTGGLDFRKKSLLMALGVVAIPLTLQLHGAGSPVAVKVSEAPRDPRVARLHGFLKKLDCPVAPLSEDFVRVADENELDWRLLPSIAVIESGGGKAYKNNNIFGWNKGEQAFATIRSGLELVAYKLGRSPLYRRHDSLGKLRIYNEHEDYPAAVMAVMNRISPDVTLRTVSDAMHHRDILDAELIQY